MNSLPARGSILRAHAELAVRWRQLGRTLLRDTPIGSTRAWLEGPGWWFFYVYSAATVALVWWMGDPGLTLFVGLIILWGVWRRR